MIYYRIKHIIFSIIVLLLVSGCGRNEYKEQLDNAESLIESQPDSALAILNNIDLKDVNTEAERALFILLKTHLTTQGNADKDSLINISTDYYKRHKGNVQELALALLYQANYLINKRDIDGGMMNLLQIEELLPEINNDYIKGYHCMLLGALYSYYHDFSNASVACQQACQYFENTKNALQWKIFVKLLEGIMYYNLSISYEKSISLFNEALICAEQVKKESAVTQCKSLLIVMYTETKQLDKAYELAKGLNEKEVEKLSVNNQEALYSSLSYLYNLKNDTDNSLKFINKAKDLLKSNGKPQSISTNRLIDIALLKNNYKEAYELSQKQRKADYDKFLSLLERPLMTSHRDYLKKELEQNKQISKVERQRNLSVLAIVLLLSFAVIFYLRKLNKDKQRKLDEYADIVIDLRSTLQKSESAATELVQTLYKDQFKILNGITDSFFNQNNDAKGQKYVYNEVKYLIEQFSKDKKALQELENTVNKCCNNVMKKLRTELPGLDEQDYRQMCYHYAGFSGKLISILLDKSQANIYMRKSRLKEKIQQSDAPSKDEILAQLV